MVLNMSKDKHKRTIIYQERYQQYQDRLKKATDNCTDKLYCYNEINDSNTHLVPQTELQANFYGFTKWLSKEHSGKIVSVILENGTYVVTWKAETKDSVCGPPSFDGIPVKYLRVKNVPTIF